MSVLSEVYSLSNPSPERSLRRWWVVFVQMWLSFTCLLAFLGAFHPEGPNFEILSKYLGIVALCILLAPSRHLAVAIPAGFLAIRGLWGLLTTGHAVSLAFIIPGAVVTYLVILHAARIELLRGNSPEREMVITMESNSDLAMLVVALAIGLSVLIIWAIK